MSHAPANLQIHQARQTAGQERGLCRAGLRTRAFACSLTKSKQSLTTMEKSSPLTPKSQPRWGHYPILPSPITRGNAASTNTLTASSGSTSQKVPTSLFCPMPMSKGSRTNSTLAPERYSATKPLARFSSAPEICPLHFTVEWASFSGRIFCGEPVPTSPENALKHDEFGLVVPPSPAVVMLRESGASSNHGERSCLLDRPPASGR